MSAVKRVGESSDSRRRRRSHGRWLGAPALALLVAAATGPAAAHATSVPLAPAISPQPGTPDASPDTQISILGVNPSRIRAVRVTGSASGRHGGRLRSYSGDRGASFVPGDPFEQGESVKVLIRIGGQDRLRDSFRIARLGATQPPLNLSQTQPDKLHHYVSRPDLTPPLIDVLHNSRAARGDGNVLLTPLPSPIVHPESNNAITIHPVGPGGPMIVAPDGHVVWFKQLHAPDVAANLRVQHYRGRRVLTWWQGSVTPSAFGLGEGVIANHAYRTIKTVKAGNGYPMDIHEFELHGRDALFTIYSPILVHLPGTAPGTRSPLLDAIVQEVDVRTGLVVWEWHSYGHIPLADSYATPANSASYDAYHINSIQSLRGRHVLLSARDTSAIYDVDKASGQIEWKLGGKDSSFRLGPDARFWFQHDARMLPDGRISMFDDEAGPPQKAPSSRGLILTLGPSRATVSRQYLRPQDTSAQSEGSLQRLDGSRVFLGFGAQPFFSEFSGGGRLLYDASLPKDDGSYRVYREPWRGTPSTTPDLVVKRGDGSVSAYASWNGATTVRRWQLLAGSQAGSLEPVGTAPARGFETRIDAATSAEEFAVRALGRDGRVLARSATVRAS